MQFANYTIESCYYYYYYYQKVLAPLTGQFADKPTRGQSSRRLVNSRTSQLTDSELFLNHGHIVIYLYAKQKNSLILTL